MNILLLTHSYPHKSNTLKSIFIKEQAKVLSLFSNVTVVLFRVDYSQFKIFSKYTFIKKVCGNLTEYEVTIKKSLPGITQIKYLLNTYRFIDKEILKKTRIDIIHSHLSYPAGFLGTIIQKRKGIPNVITEHTRIQAYSRSWFHKFCLNYTFINAGHIISVSNTLKTEIDKIFHRSISVIPNFVSVEKFKLSSKKLTDKLSIGFIGGLGNYNKGLDILLQSISRFDNRDVLLQIGGGGSLIDDFKRSADELGIGMNCKFYGEIPRDKITEFYSGIDLFVLPSRYETFGIVLIEAMSCGIPVIATRCGGPEDIITQETGLLIEKDNIDELTSAIKSMWGNLVYYNKDIIRKYAKENFGQEIFIERITDLYKEILKTSIK